jgi:N-acetylmuramoyl-L-alanine amidase
MKLYFKIIFVLLLGNTCHAQDTTVQSKIKYYTEKVQRYLDKEKALSPYYSINYVGIKTFSSAKNKSENKPEFTINWSDLDNYKSESKHAATEELLNIYKSGIYEWKKHHLNNSNDQKDSAVSNQTQKLQGIKIAIDAGHTAGSIGEGKEEQKFLNFKPNPTLGITDSIEIAEGMLTFATAKLLKEKLEAEGAEVFLTRKTNGSTAFGITFDEWLTNNYKNTVESLFNSKKITLEKKNFLLSSKATKRDKFKLVFKDLELQKRAAIINNYHPDFTIIIHYNVDETNTGWIKPANKNFDMTFVGGAFMKKDLSSPEKRFEFLRLLFTDDLEKSIKLSSAVVKSFETILKVKTATQNDATYLKEGCLPTNESGVYCRNLQLTRYIHSPLVYGETLYQDNINECKLLNKECDKTQNERVQQISEAYFKGILTYCNNKQ